MIMYILRVCLGNSENLSGLNADQTEGVGRNYISVLESILPYNKLETQSKEVSIKYF